MASMRANRLQVGSAPWVAEERASALQIAQAETEEFTFSARNEVEWLNEHMAEIFSENQVNVAEIFKTPGKLRGKTPRTIRKHNPLGERAPLTDIFSATPQHEPSPFKKIHFEKPIPTFRVAEDLPTPVDEAGPSITNTRESTSPPRPIHSAFDSGYHGSQPDDATQQNEPVRGRETPRKSPLKPAEIEEPFEADEEDEEDDENVVILGRDSDVQKSGEESFQSAKEEQARKIEAPVVEEVVNVEVQNKNNAKELSYPVLESPLLDRQVASSSPQKRSPQRSSPVKQPALTPALEANQEMDIDEPVLEAEDEHMEDVQSPSDGSSPIRPIVRKSSLNFASLPAREPLTNKKSIGNRVSRTSQLEQSRTSYYGRQTGGKSLGAGGQDKEEDDEMDVDLDEPEPSRDDTDSKIMRLHNKTSTQRLQDQISMLGQSQNVRPSKSIPSHSTVLSQTSQPALPAVTRETKQNSPQRSPQRSPERKSRPPPGAFPDDEDDSWIGPPNPAAPETSIFSPRPGLTKSHTADVMEEVHGKESISGTQFNIPKRGDQQRNASPVREPVIPDRTAALGHIKSVSTSVLRSPRKAGDSPEHRKPIAVSNPNPSISSNDDGSSTTPPKSPGRSFRGSPLKAAKDKFSSILKTSRGLFASSAAVSAEAKTNALSPVPARIASNNEPTFEEALAETTDAVQYPELGKVQSKGSQLSLRLPDSPFKHNTRKTRASTEREEKRKEEEAKEAKAAKEAKEVSKLTDKLEKERMKVREEARVYHLEQERVAAMQREYDARKEQEKKAKASQVDLPKATRTSPRKTKAQLEAEAAAAASASMDELSSKDVDMVDSSQGMPPPARPKSQIGRPIAKRPIKPAKETAKSKPPTVIRVDTGSQRGHQYHPSNTTLAASLQDSLSSSQSVASSQALKHKVSTSSIQSKASSNGVRSGATKALEAAARKKEQDELAATKKREAKLEIERQRAAIKEEERRKEEQQRRQEAERQREIQREREKAASIADAKKAASKQAIEKRRLEMEKAKETRAPPPAPRPQPNGDMATSSLQDKALPPLPQQAAGPSKAPQMNQSAHRIQPDMGRSVNSVLPHGAKVPPKRPLQQDTEDHHSRPTLQRNGPSYQQNEQQSKRRKTEDFDDDEDMTDNQPKMKAPPIRQSSIRQKDAPTKSLFPSGYTNAPPPNNLQRATLISQHNLNQSKPAHPMDMAQLSKAPIPFASSSSMANSQHKTPARPGAPNGTGKSGVKSGMKSAAKSSPRYQNGENIDLPEIHTDSEDEDSDGGDFVALGWTNSPDLRKQLVSQEAMDPAEVFGNPGPLNMEEVFSKSKDRFHKFRARTSSANWSGQDRLTEDEIKKDLEARDRVRRQGGWTYDTMV